MKITRRLVTAGFPAVLLSQTNSSETRVAFVGAGNRGAQLAKTLASIPNAKIVAIADVNATRAAEIARLYDGAAVYTDFRKMLDERKDIDVVIIATPVNTHKDIAIAVLEMGRHVYLEKPVAINPEECAQVATAAKTAKGILQVGLQLRHDPARAAGIKFIQEGKLGKVIYLHATRHGGDLPHDAAWYFDRTKSGDIIVEQAVHIIDIMVWAAGGPPARAMGSGGINLYKDDPAGRTSMDNWSAIWEWADGKRFNMSQIYFDPPGFSGAHERVFGTEGAIDLPTAVFHPRGSREPGIPLEVDLALNKDATYNSLSAFLDNARGRKKPLNDIESARQSTLVAMMARKAIYEGRVVNWRELSRR